MTVDIDNLLGIVIYLVDSIQYPEIIAECFFIMEFTKNEQNANSTSYYILILQASIEHLLKETILSSKESF